MLVQESKLNRILESTVNNKSIFGVAVNIEPGDDDFRLKEKRICDKSPKVTVIYD
ncbi:hypothetical protein RBU61_13360 [Tissierella sp. MB52-C2]|uniref:hypothetical protein n=1 Tax=Tissierella sp. MB52-C2 TaxID=3070999 RepID=UPI00280A738B|nr:hypothetical protein [Tissierella sp. MB52-C2]WMM23905.1 hypothetical protein RBU61_13360 [Tissierella sp. MB52-C2]